MTTIDDVQTWQGRTVTGPEGEKIGTVEDVYLDRETGEPEWLTVKTGLFGARLSFVPISAATASGEELSLAFGKQLVKDAPEIHADCELSPDEERELHEHYGRAGADRR